jgi:aspartate/methionine/tyrosine aminotransferase
MYSFPRISLPKGAIDAATKKGKQPDVMYCLELLEETGISTVVDLGAYNVAMSALLELWANSEANPGYIRSSLGVGPASETDQC